jgi:hypothetical protein
MSDIATGEAPPEASIPPAPEAAELEVAPQDAAAPAEDSFRHDAENSEHAPEPGLTEHPLGSLRQRISDHLLDTDEPQSVAQLLAAVPAGVSRNTLESAIRRSLAANEISRVSPGCYALAPPRPPEQPKPEEPKPEPQPDRDKEREAALARDRIRKQQERARDRDAAAAKREDANRELRAKLIAACRHGNRQNYAPGLASDDLTPIKMLLALGVSTDVIELAVHWRTETEALTSWRDQPLLRKAWEFFGRIQIIPSLMQGRAEAAPKPASTPEASPAGDQENASVPSPERSEAIDQAPAEIDLRGPLARSSKGQRAKDRVQDRLPEPEARANNSDSLDYLHFKI